MLSCDSTVSPTDKLSNAPTVSQLIINPQTFTFTPSDGFKDTTLTVLISATIENVDSETMPGFVIRDKNSSTLITNGDLLAQNQAGLFAIESEIETTTTAFNEYIVEVYAYNAAGGGNFFQTTISVEGFSNNPPEIIEVNNPEEVQRPESGSTSVSFTAKTTDIDGQTTIEGVFLRLISQVSGEVSGSPFQLFDDGSSQNDVAANDSVFTASFPVSSTNQLQTYDILYYAVDKGGLVSDTVKTTFSIRGN